MSLEVATFLSMNGSAKEAIDFYQEVFHAELLLLVTYEDMMEKDPTFSVAEEDKGNVSHSVLRIGKSKVMIAENTMDPTENFHLGNNISLCIQSVDLMEIQSFYKKITAHKKTRIIMPLAKNVFSGAYGIVEDPFGIQIQLMHDTRLS